MTNLRIMRAAALLASAALFSGCGGGESGIPFSRTGTGSTPNPSTTPIATSTPAQSATPTPTSTAAATPSPSSGATAGPSSNGATYVQFAITFPARTATTGSIGSGRKPAYVSPSIQSLAFTIDTGTATYVNAPAPNGSPQTVTTTLPITAGSHGFLLAEYDQASGEGNLLGRVSQTGTMIAGDINPVNYTLDGQLAEIAIEPAVTPFIEGTAATGYTLVGCQPETFSAVPEDADGNTIVTPGLVPAIAVASGTSASIAETALTGNQFSLEAPGPAAMVPVTASGQNLDGKTITSAINVSALAAFYVADFTAQKVRAFDENGTPLTLPQGAFLNLSNPMGLAASPCTATAGGDLYVTETSNFESPFVQEYDLSGNQQTLAASAFPFPSGNYIVAQPLFLTYAAGQLVTPDEYSSAVSFFDLSGDSVAMSTGAFPGLLQPAGVAYDTNDKQYYITSDGSNTLSAFSSTGAAVAKVTTNSHPMGVVFDSNNNSLYVASGGTTLAVLSEDAPANANVAEYSEAPAAVMNTGGFTATSTTAFYTGITFDPYSKQLYVSDAGDSSIVAYTETGTAVTLPTGAFGTVNATSSPKGDPMAILFVP